MYPSHYTVLRLLFELEKFTTCFHSDCLICVSRSGMVVIGQLKKGPLYIRNGWGLDTQSNWNWENYKLSPWHAHVSACILITETDCSLKDKRHTIMHAHTYTLHIIRKTSNSTSNFCNFWGHAFSQFNAKSEYIALNFIKACVLSVLFILLTAFSKNSLKNFTSLPLIWLHFSGVPLSTSAKGTLCVSVK